MAMGKHQLHGEHLNMVTCLASATHWLACQQHDSLCPTLPSDKCHDTIQNWVKILVKVN